MAGAFEVDTSSSTFKCDDINNLGNNQVVRGNVNCQSGDSSPTTSNGGSGTGSRSSSSSSGFAVPLDLPVWTTGSGLIVSLLSFFFLL